MHVETGHATVGVQVVIGEALPVGQAPDGAFLYRLDLQTGQHRIVDSLTVVSDRVIPDTDLTLDGPTQHR